MDIVRLEVVFFAIRRENNDLKRHFQRYTKQIDYPT